MPRGRRARRGRQATLRQPADRARTAAFGADTADLTADHGRRQPGLGGHGRGGAAVAGARAAARGRGRLRRPHRRVRRRRPARHPRGRPGAPGARPAVAGSVAFLAEALFIAAVPYLGGTVPACAALAVVGVLNGFGNVVMLTIFQRWAPPDLQPAHRPAADRQLRRVPDLRGARRSRGPWPRPGRVLPASRGDDRHPPPRRAQPANLAGLRHDGPASHGGRR